ncbi:hypothetical protein CEUSTIGMA_g766.t1 [Chlamydomonas eustigma]|uniref:Uncharacterized protein n=1 Tax=Chlamydomonas eustigma TaxID=1157962 RepID=A0A250WRL6_9CHLO|nr:hypothetical protein CEUSTIGMA_g766.t1 [Chlamydomonas eustigma]|eukprot:GAX73312.1 hypothetical protein CEUSTIGMA_g766.t1 [Chlamydomonas eustigma]
MDKIRTSEICHLLASDASTDMLKAWLSENGASGASVPGEVGLLIKLRFLKDRLHEHQADLNKLGNADRVASFQVKGLRIEDVATLESILEYCKELVSKELSPYLLQLGFEALLAASTEVCLRLLRPIIRSLDKANSLTNSAVSHVVEYNVHQAATAPHSHDPGHLYSAPECHKSMKCNLPAGDLIMAIDWKAFVSTVQLLLSPQSSWQAAALDPDEAEATVEERREELLSCMPEGRLYQLKLHMHGCRQSPSNAEKVCNISDESLQQQHMHAACMELDQHLMKVGRKYPESSYAHNAVVGWLEAVQVQLLGPAMSAHISCDRSSSGNRFTHSPAGVGARGGAGAGTSGKASWRDSRCWRLSGYKRLLSGGSRRSGSRVAAAHSPHSTGACPDGKISGPRKGSAFITHSVIDRKVQDSPCANNAYPNSAALSPASHGSKPEPTTVHDEVLTSNLHLPTSMSVGTMNAPQTSEDAFISPHSQRAGLNASSDEEVGFDPTTCRLEQSLNMSIHAAESAPRLVCTSPSPHSSACHIEDTESAVLVGLMPATNGICDGGTSITSMGCASSVAKEDEDCNDGGHVTRAVVREMMVEVWKHIAAPEFIGPPSCPVESSVSHEEMQFQFVQETEESHRPLEALKAQSCTAALANPSHQGLGDPSTTTQLLTFRSSLISPLLPGLVENCSHNSKSTEPSAYEGQLQATESCRIHTLVSSVMPQTESCRIHTLVSSVMPQTDSFSFISCNRNVPQILVDEGNGQHGCPADLGNLRPCSEHEPFSVLTREMHCDISQVQLCPVNSLHQGSQQAEGVNLCADKAIQPMLESLEDHGFQQPIAVTQGTYFIQESKDAKPAVSRNEQHADVSLDVDQVGLQFTIQADSDASLLQPTGGSLNTDESHMLLLETFSVSDAGVITDSKLGVVDHSLPHSILNIDNMQHLHSETQLLWASDSLNPHSSLTEASISQQQHEGEDLKRKIQLVAATEVTEQQLIAAAEVTEQQLVAEDPGIRKKSSFLGTLTEAEPHRVTENRHQRALAVSETVHQSVEIAAYDPGQQCQPVMAVLPLAVQPVAELQNQEAETVAEAGRQCHLTVVDTSAEILSIADTVITQAQLVAGANELMPLVNLSRAQPLSYVPSNQGVKPAGPLSVEVDRFHLQQQQVLQDTVSNPNPYYAHTNSSFAEALNDLYQHSRHDVLMKLAESHLTHDDDDDDVQGHADSHVAHHDDDDVQGHADSHVAHHDEDDVLGHADSHVNQDDNDVQGHADSHVNQDDDDVQGHADGHVNQDDDDVHGHADSHVNQDDDDVQGHADCHVNQDDDDVQGHADGHVNQDDDDVQGHADSHVAHHDDDDVQGHADSHVNQDDDDVHGHADSHVVAHHDDDDVQGHADSHVAHHDDDVQGYADSHVAHHDDDDVQGHADSHVVAHHDDDDVQGHADSHVVAHHDDDDAQGHADSHVAHHDDDDVQGRILETSLMGPALVRSTTVLLDVQSISELSPSVVEESRRVEITSTSTHKALIHSPSPPNYQKDDPVTLALEVVEQMISQLDRDEPPTVVLAAPCSRSNVETMWQLSRNCTSDVMAAGDRVSTGLEPKLGEEGENVQASKWDEADVDDVADHVVVGQPSCTDLQADVDDVADHVVVGQPLCIDLQADVDAREATMQEASVRVWTGSTMEVDFKYISLDSDKMPEPGGACTPQSQKACEQEQSGSMLMQEAGACLFESANVVAGYSVSLESGQNDALTLTKPEPSLSVLQHNKCTPLAVSYILNPLDSSASAQILPASPSDPGLSGQSPCICAGIPEKTLARLEPARIDECFSSKHKCLEPCILPGPDLEIILTTSQPHPLNTHAVTESNQKLQSCEETLVSQADYLDQHCSALRKQSTSVNGHVILPQIPALTVQESAFNRQISFVELNESKSCRSNPTVHWNFISTCAQASSVKGQISVEKEYAMRSMGEITAVTHEQARPVKGPAINRKVAESALGQYIAPHGIISPQDAGNNVQQEMRTARKPASADSEHVLQTAPVQNRVQRRLLSDFASGKPGCPVKVYKGFHSSHEKELSAGALQCHAMTAKEALLLFLHGVNIHVPKDPLFPSMRPAQQRLRAVLRKATLMRKRRRRHGLIDPHAILAVQEGALMPDEVGSPCKLGDPSGRCRENAIPLIRKEDIPLMRGEFPPTKGPANCCKHSRTEMTLPSSLLLTRADKIDYGALCTLCLKAHKVERNTCMSETLCQCGRSLIGTCASAACISQLTIHNNVGVQPDLTPCGAVLSSSPVTAGSGAGTPSRAKNERPRTIHSAGHSAGPAASYAPPHAAHGPEVRAKPGLAEPSTALEGPAASSHATPPQSMRDKLGLVEPPACIPSATGMKSLQTSNLQGQKTAVTAHGSRATSVASLKETRNTVAKSGINRTLRGCKTSSVSKREAGTFGRRSIAAVAAAAGRTAAAAGVGSRAAVAAAAGRTAAAAVGSRAVVAAAAGRTAAAAGVGSRTVVAAAPESSTSAAAAAESRAATYEDLVYAAKTGSTSAAAAAAAAESRAAIYEDLVDAAKTGSTSAAAAAAAAAAESRAATYEDLVYAAKTGSTSAAAAAAAAESRAAIYEDLVDTAKTGSTSAAAAAAAAAAENRAATYEDLVYAAKKGSMHSKPAEALSTLHDAMIPLDETVLIDSAEVPHVLKSTEAHCSDQHPIEGVSMSNLALKRLPDAHVGSGSCRSDDFKVCFDANDAKIQMDAELSPSDDCLDDCYTSDPPEFAQIHVRHTLLPLKHVVQLQESHHLQQPAMGRTFRDEEGGEAMRDRTMKRQLTRSLIRWFLAHLHQEDDVGDVSHPHGEVEGALMMRPSCSKGAGCLCEGVLDLCVEAEPSQQEIEKQHHDEEGYGNEVVMHQGLHLHKQQHVQRAAWVQWQSEVKESNALQLCQETDGNDHSIMQLLMQRKPSLRHLVCNAVVENKMQVKRSPIENESFEEAAVKRLRTSITSSFSRLGGTQTCKNPDSHDCSRSPVGREILNGKTEILPSALFDTDPRLSSSASKSGFILEGLHASEQPSLCFTSALNRIDARSYSMQNKEVLQAPAASPCKARWSMTSASQDRGHEVQAHLSQQKLEMPAPYSNAVRMEWRDDKGSWETRTRLRLVASRPPALVNSGRLWQMKTEVADALQQQQSSGPPDQLLGQKETLQTIETLIKSIPPQQPPLKLQKSSNRGPLKCSSFSKLPLTGKEQQHLSWSSFVRSITQHTDHPTTTAHGSITFPVDISDVSPNASPPTLHGLLPASPTSLPSMSGSQDVRSRPLSEIPLTHEALADIATARLHPIITNPECSPQRSQGPHNTIMLDPKPQGTQGPHNTIMLDPKPQGTQGPHDTIMLDPKPQRSQGPQVSARPWVSPAFPGLTLEGLLLNRSKHEGLDEARENHESFNLHMHSAHSMASEVRERSASVANVEGAGYDVQELTQDNKLALLQTCISFIWPESEHSQSACMMQHMDHSGQAPLPAGIADAHYSSTMGHKGSQITYHHTSQPGPLQTPHWLDTPLSQSLQPAPHCEPEPELTTEPVKSSPATQHHTPYTAVSSEQQPGRTHSSPYQRPLPHSHLGHTSQLRPSSPLSFLHQLELSPVTSSMSQMLTPHLKPFITECIQGNLKQQKEYVQESISHHPPLSPPPNLGPPQAMETPPSLSPTTECSYHHLNNHALVASSQSSDEQLPKAPPFNKPHLDVLATAGMEVQQHTVCNNSCSSEMAAPAAADYIERRGWGHSPGHADTAEKVQKNSNITDQIFKLDKDDMRSNELSICQTLSAFPNKSAPVAATAAQQTAAQLTAVPLTAQSFSTCNVPQRTSITMPLPAESWMQGSNQVCVLKQKDAAGKLHPQQTSWSPADEAASFFTYRSVQGDKKRKHKDTLTHFPGVGGKDLPALAGAASASIAATAYSVSPTATTSIATAYGVSATATAIERRLWHKMPLSAGKLGVDQGSVAGPSLSSCPPHHKLPRSEMARFMEDSHWEIKEVLDSYQVSMSGGEGAMSPPDQTMNECDTGIISPDPRLEALEIANLHNASCYPATAMEGISSEQPEVKGTYPPHAAQSKVVNRKPAPAAYSAVMVRQPTLVNKLSKHSSKLGDSLKDSTADDHQVPPVQPTPLNCQPIKGYLDGSSSLLHPPTSVIASSVTTTLSMNDTAGDPAITDVNPPESVHPLTSKKKLVHALTLPDLPEELAEVRPLDNTTCQGLHKQDIPDINPQQYEGHNSCKALQRNVFRNEVEDSEAVVKASLKQDDSTAHSSKRMTRSSCHEFCKEQYTSPGPGFERLCQKVSPRDRYKGVASRTLGSCGKAADQDAQTQAETRDTLPHVICSISFASISSGLKSGKPFPKPGGDGSGGSVSIPSFTLHPQFLSGSAPSNEAKQERCIQPIPIPRFGMSYRPSRQARKSQMLLTQSSLQQSQSKSSEPPAKNAIETFNNKRSKLRLNMMPGIHSGFSFPVKRDSDNDSFDSGATVFGTSPDSVLPHQVQQLITSPKDFAVLDNIPSVCTPQRQQAAPKKSLEHQNDLLTLSLQTVVGISELLGHALEDRREIASKQDLQLASNLRDASAVPLRDSSQRPAFIVAPLDVLVTHEGADGLTNKFHIIEINGTGYAGITNMPAEIIQTMMTSLKELPNQLQHISDPIILVASSGQESQPPVSRTMHEKVLYIEALKKGFEAQGRPCHITNMKKLEQKPESMPHSGPTLVLGYMKQLRNHISLDSEGRLLLMGRQIHAAINDRFVLNIMHQFHHQVNLHEFMGYNQCFAAGADKGVAYELYNQFFGEHAEGLYKCMAPSIRYERAFSEEGLVASVESWLSTKGRPVVIKPQGTGCGHGIEFFFGDESTAEIQSKVQEALRSVSTNYNLECGGLPYTICEFLDTATVCPEAGQKQHMVGHKFEIRIVVYRDGDELKAFPSIAKVARAAFDPEDQHPDKAALINNITTSAKETAQSGAEFMLPLCWWV